MPLSGKYDFKGIKQWGAKGLELALTTTAWGAWLLATPVLRTVLHFSEEFLVNWFANKGLILLNIGAIYVNGKLDEEEFSKALNDGLARVEIPGGRALLTPEEGKAIDEAVKKAGRKFIPYNKSK